MNTVDRSPTRFGRLLAVTAAAVAVLIAGGYSLSAFALGTVGAIVLVVGVVRGSHPVVSLGGTVLFAGVLAAGTVGAPAVVLLVATVATVLAWDVAGNAVTLGEQLGTAPSTTRVEAVHAGTTALVGVVVAAVGLVLFETVTTGAPVTALVFLLLSAVLVAYFFR